MKISNDYIKCLPIIAFQAIFIAHSIKRIWRHWKDGTEPEWRRWNWELRTKQLLVLILICSTLPQAILAKKKESLIYVFYASVMLGWVTSLVLFEIEYRKKLTMKFIGHRGFLIISFSLLLTIFILDRLNEKKYIFDEFSNASIICAVIYLFCSLVLAVFAVFRPNGFKKSDDSPTMIYEKPVFRSLSCSIKDYKIKFDEHNKQIVKYKIEVKVEDKVFIVEKTYIDFKHLNESVKKIYPKCSYPVINCPELPSFSPQISRDLIIQNLNNYLKKVCRTDFFNENTLDFLDIQGEIREELLKKHKNVFENESILQFSKYSQSDCVNLSVINFEPHHESVWDSIKSSTRFCENYVTIKITTNIDSNNKVNYYKVKSKTVFGKNKVKKTFKEFVEIHKALKKTLNPAILPKFPNQSFFSLPSQIDKEAIEKRRKKLERYLIHVFNDPAYHNQQIFGWLGIQENFRDLWTNCSEKYEIVLPLEWEGVLTNDHFVFIITVKKATNQKSFRQWQARRYFQEFKDIDEFLKKRNTSSHLAEFYKHKNVDFENNWPELPKNICGVTGDIEGFKQKLENYLVAISNIPLIHESYALGCFFSDFSGRVV